MDYDAEIKRAAEDIRARYSVARKEAPETAFIISRRGGHTQEYKDKLTAELMATAIAEQIADGKGPAVEYYGTGRRRARHVAAILSASPQLAEYDAEAKQEIIKEVFSDM